MHVKYRRNRESVVFANEPNEYDKNEMFVIIKTLQYLKAHLSRYFRLNDQTFEILCWILGADAAVITDYFLSFMSEKQKSKFKGELEDISPYDDDYPELLNRIFKKLPIGISKKAKKYFIEIINSKINALPKGHLSDIEKNAEYIKNMFQFSNHEMDLLIFLFINEVYSKPRSYFFHYLDCNDISGRKFLCNILNINQRNLTSILNGKIKKIEIIDNYRSSIDMNTDFLVWFENPSNEVLSKNLYEKLPSDVLPLEYFLIEPFKIKHVLRLLKKKQKTSTHILLYGPPGSGKTSFAYSIANELGIPSYKILGTDDNKSIGRQASIMACLNMTNTGLGSLVLVDESDNILNTGMSYLLRGETQDKGWLNQFLDEPDSRIIWITNYIENIEPSVLRRFAYSIHFKPFNQSQRRKLWDVILCKHKTRHLVTTSDIDNLSKKYSASAGAINIAVLKAIEIKSKTKKDFLSSISTSLDAHLVLTNNGVQAINKDKIELNYSLDGLNIEADMEHVLRQLKMFDTYSKKSSKEDICNFNLLFSGPPGTGKSELARFIAQQLDRKILHKRISDIQSMWVGEGEKNIKKAFEEAETEDAVMVIDEADTFLFQRERARHSWEISFTNEFLTQMERFHGILICTTNQIMDLDKASIRRFSHKITFDYLTPQGNVIFYKKMLVDLLNSKLNKQNEREIKSIEYLAPGDFKTVKNKFYFYPKGKLDHRTLISALKDETKYKLIGVNQKIGF